MSLNEADQPGIVTITRTFKMIAQTTFATVATTLLTMPSPNPTEVSLLNTLTTGSTTEPLTDSQDPFTWLGNHLTSILSDFIWGICWVLVGGIYGLCLVDLAMLMLGLLFVMAMCVFGYTIDETQEVAKKCVLRARQAAAGHSRATVKEERSLENGAVPSRAEEDDDNEVEEDEREEGGEEYEDAEEQPDGESTMTPESSEEDDETVFESDPLYDEARSRLSATLKLLRERRAGSRMAI